VIQLLTVLLPVAYLLATFHFVLALLAAGEGGIARGDRAPRSRRAAIALAVGLHVGWFATRAVAVGGMPELSAWGQVSALVLCMVLLHLWTARGDHPGTGLVVFTLAGLLQLAASGLGPLEPAVATDRPAPFYLVHVSSILVASASLVLSGLYGVLYLLLFRHLRARRFGPLYAGLPSLEELSLFTRRAALAAFCLLLIGVNGGIWWAHASGAEGFRYTDPFVLVMLSLVAHFGVVAFSGRIPGLTARRASIAAAAGLTLLLLSLVALQLARVGFHTAP
jgi:ABC-type uncharacterized transport system permease subunit